MIKHLEKLGVNLKNNNKKADIQGKLNQETFLFTGSLPTLKRSDAEELVEKNGGKLLGSVSGKLNYLVVGEDAGSKLDKAKKIGSIKILSEEEFLKMF
jgi:DNA ligase (NAD+)